MSMGTVNTVFTKLQPSHTTFMTFPLLANHLYYYLLILRKYIDLTLWVTITALPQEIILRKGLAWKASNIFSNHIKYVTILTNTTIRIKVCVYHLKSGLSQSYMYCTLGNTDSSI